MMRDGRRVILAGGAAVLLAVIAYDFVSVRRMEREKREGMPAGAFAPVDVNRAPEEELATLPGIGPALARGIAEERAKGGPFEKIEDLARVKGITRATIERMRPLASCGEGSP
ncbi:MAG: helix-hairpin-helix domain-containing protein [Planctomycetota bacterium]